MTSSPERSILITGASRGIPAATARLCAARGCRVGVNYLRSASAAHAVAEDVAKAGGEAVLLQGDIADPAQMEAMFDAFGPLDGFVNNAGVLAMRMPFIEMQAARIADIVRVNVTGALLCAQAAARRMARSRGGKGGAIVNVSSAAARLGGAGEYVDYAATKGAMDTLTLGLSKELGAEGVRVNAVRPGLIDTDIHADGGWPDRAHALGAGTPLGRAGTADEVAQTIVWLLSDDASYVNGALLDVTGGR